MSSIRLPKKVSLPIFDNKNSIELMVNRLKSLKENIIIASSVNNEDDFIENLAKSLKVKYFRGDLKNVLKRFYDCANSLNLADDAIIVRLTADCPFIDEGIVLKVVEEFKKRNFCYVSNTLNRTYPKGLDTEVFSFETLKRAYKYAKTDYEKEHTSPIIYTNKKLFTTFNVLDKFDNSRYNISLDTKEDYILIKALYKKLNSINFSYEELIKLLKKEYDKLR